MFAKFSVKKPLTVFVSVIMIIILGCVSFNSMTPDLLPSINLPYTMVMTVYAGATPEEVEGEITQPMESVMASLEDVENISSTSSENVSVVILEFSDDANMDTVVSDIREKINGISGEWSEFVSTPYIMEINPDLMPVTVTALNYEGMDSIELTDFLNTELLSELEGISGVASVDVTGEVVEQVDVIISQEKVDELNEKILEAINEQFDDALVEVEDGESQLDDGIDELEKQESELGDALTQLEDGQDTLVDETASAQADLLQQKFELSETKSDLETQLTSAKEGLVTLQSTITSLEQALESYDYLLEQKAQIEQVISALETIDTAYPQAAEALALIEAQLEALLEDPELNAELIESYTAQLVELQTEIMVMEATLSALGANSENMSEMLEMYKSNQLLINDGIDSLSLSLSSLDIDIDMLDETIAELYAQETMIEEGITTLELAITQIEEGSLTITDAIE